MFSRTFERETSSFLGVFERIDKVFLAVHRGYTSFFLYFEKNYVKFSHSFLLDFGRKKCNGRNTDIFTQYKRVAS